MSEKTVSVGLVMPQKLYGALVVDAGKQGLSISAYVRRMLQESLGLPVEATSRRMQVAQEYIKSLDSGEDSSEDGDEPVAIAEEVEEAGDEFEAEPAA